MTAKARVVLVICAVVLATAACATSGNVSQAPDRPEPRYNEAVR